VRHKKLLVTCYCEHILFSIWNLGEEKLVIRLETTADDSIVSMLFLMNETLMQTHQLEEDSKQES